MAIENTQWSGSAGFPSGNIPEKQERILLVDDNKSILELMAHLIEGIGYSAITALDGLAAIEHLKKHEISLIITDIAMPGFNGMQLLEHVRNHFPKTDVIVMTGYVEDYNYVDVINAGAIDFIAKPFTDDEVRAKLQRVFKERYLVENLRQEIENSRLKEEEIRRYSEKTRKLVYFISHDLKNPLIGIHGLAKRLLVHYGPMMNEKGLHVCEQIKRSAEEVLSLVEIINDYIASKELFLTTETINLKELLRTIREEHENQLNERRITWSEPADIPTMQANREEIIRAIRNLVDNALKYGGENLTKIEIVYKETDTFHVISVNNDGTELSTEDHEAVFSPFVRKHKNVTIRGCGLGLAIVQEIAAKHGGRAWGEKYYPNGVSFNIAIDKRLK